MNKFEEREKLVVDFMDYFNLPNAKVSYHFAKKYHTGTRRDNVTPEFDHQVSMALHASSFINTDINMDLIMSAIFLHDVMEDYNVSSNELLGIFDDYDEGKQIVYIVELLTKEFNGVKKDTKTYFDNISTNPNAAIVKLIDRYHNLQSMVGVFSNKKQREYIQEVKEYFMPMFDAVLGAAAFIEFYVISNLGLMIENQCEIIGKTLDFMENYDGK